MDELSRSGDLFLALFRNPADGMSYVRAVPKSEIVELVTAENDWERELSYVVRSGGVGGDGPLGTLTFLSPDHPDAAAADAVMVHYSINRPVGALLGESELASILPALRWYGRMLEDRVRLNWAARAFLWFVTVPTGRVNATITSFTR